MSRNKRNWDHLVNDDGTYKPLGGGGGTAGEKGQKGSDGQKGEKGVAGAVDKGEKGQKGLDGTASAKGDVGPKGDKGSIGPTAEKGQKGIKGAKGQKGDKGEKGQKGQEGTKGDTGTKGETGTGQKGEQGQKGETGTGLDGDKGQKGQTGSGDKGQKGEDGSAAAKGDVGPKGQKGEAGSDGDKGQKGEGDKGQKGEGGTNGNDGTKGQKGQDGTAGDKGQKGQAGSGTPAGANTQVQFNNSGSFGASGGLTFDDTTDALGVSGSVNVPAISHTDILTISTTANDGDININPNGDGAVRSTGGYVADGECSFNNGMFCGTGQAGLIQFEGFDANPTDFALTNINLILGAGTGSTITTDDGAGNPSTGTAGQALLSTGTGTRWGNPAGSLPSRTTVSGTTASIADNAAADLDLTVAPSYLLHTIETDRAAWVRVYTTAAARTADNARTITTDPTPGSGVLTEIVTTGAATVSLTPGTFGWNGDNPAASTVYLAVTNLSGATSTVTVTLQTVALES